MSRGVIKVPKKCHVLLEWPLFEGQFHQLLQPTGTNKMRSIFGKMALDVWCKNLAHKYSAWAQLKANNC